MRDKILHIFIENESETIEFDALRDAIVFYGKHNLHEFLDTLAHLCEEEILYQNDGKVFIKTVELYVKRVLRLRYKLSASLLCLFVFAYKRDIVNGKKVIIKMNDLVKLWHWADHGYDLMSAKSGTKWQSIQELKRLGFIEPIRYKVYKFNYVKLGRGLIKIILNTTSAYYNVELPNLPQP